MAVSKPATAILQAQARSRTSAPARATTVRAVPPAIATWSVAGVIVAVWLLEEILIGAVHGRRSIGYLAFGALPNATVAGRGGPGDWWRYLTTGLVHVNGVQVLINVTTLLLVGRRVERRHGALVVLGTSAISAAAAGFAWVAASSFGLSGIDRYSVGASGGICGLAGLLLVHGRFGATAASAGRVRADRLIAALAISIVVLPGMLIPGVNTWAHLGGLACGGLLGLRVPALERRGGRTLTMPERAVLVAAVGLAALAVAIAAQHLGQVLLEPG